MLPNFKEELVDSVSRLPYEIQGDNIYIAWDWAIDAVNEYTNHGEDIPDTLNELIKFVGTSDGITLEPA